MSTRGAPPGNDFAVGNSGGAPEGNANGKTHGATVDVDKLNDRLDPSTAHYVDILAGTIERRCDPLTAVQARRLALQFVKLQRAEEYVMDCGLMRSVDQLNPMVKHSRLLSHQVFDELADTGAFEYAEGH